MAEMNVDTPTATVASSSSSSSSSLSVANPPPKGQALLSSAVTGRRIMRGVYPFGQFEGFVFEKTELSKEDAQRHKAIVDKHKPAYGLMYQDANFLPTKDIAVGVKMADGKVVDAVWGTRVSAPSDRDLAFMPTSTIVELPFVKKELDEMGSVEKAELTPASRICVGITADFAGFVLGSDLCNAFKEPRKKRRARTAELAEDGSGGGGVHIAKKTRAAVAAAATDESEKKAAAVAAAQQSRKNDAALLQQDDADEPDDPMLDGDGSASIEAIKAQFQPDVLLPKEVERMNIVEFGMTMTRFFMGAATKPQFSDVKACIDKLVPADEKSLSEWKKGFASSEKLGVDVVLATMVKICAQTAALYTTKAEDVLADAAQLVKKQKAADLARYNAVATKLSAFENAYQIEKAAREEAAAAAAAAVAAAAAAAAAHKGPHLIDQITALMNGTDN
jgi:hypothetical protein